MIELGDPGLAHQPWKQESHSLENKIPLHSNPKKPPHLLEAYTVS